MTSRPGMLSINSRERWIKAGVFESLAHDLREVLRIAEGRKESPAAAIFDSRTLQSTPESGARAGNDGAKRRKGERRLGQRGGVRPDCRPEEYGREPAPRPWNGLTCRSQ